MSNPMASPDLFDEVFGNSSTINTGGVAGGSNVVPATVPVKSPTAQHRQSLTGSTPIFSSYQSTTPTSHVDASALKSNNGGAVGNENLNKTHPHHGSGIENPNYSRSPNNEISHISADGGASAANSSINSPTVVVAAPSSGDKTPLLHGGDLLRSLSGAIGRPGMLDSYVFGLSTFSGVFCPVALSMLSVLLYLRLGFVVGQAGVFFAIVILVLAYGIILFTALSLCAVSTNGAIEGGGVYYMISRALGPEFGGSIGVLFFMANIFACALSLAGLSEAMINNFGPGGYMVSPDFQSLPTGRWYHFAYSLFISMVTLLVCLIGAGLFAKTSLVTLIVVVVTYLSFLLSLALKNRRLSIALPRDNPISNSTQYANYTGVSGETFNDNLYANWTIDYTTLKPMNFETVFGVVFSGVTGLMAGANMSGDLKKPDVSIPKGTLAATFSTFTLYVTTVLLLASSCSRELLLNNYIVIQNINVWPPFIFIGIFATSLASAMSNLIGASRVLNRVAEDKLFGYLLYPFLKRMCGNNPVYSVLFAWALVVAVLLIGALNTIAQATSVFFLLSYAGVNLACLALDLTSAPNFRPTFKYFTWHTAFMGFVGSITMMFVINPGASGAAIICLMLLLIVLHYRGPVPASWGSISQALLFHQVRKYLLMLDTRKEHVKFWRPQILLLVANPKSCLPLIDFVNDLKKSGLYVLGHVTLDQPADHGSTLTTIDINSTNQNAAAGTMTSSAAASSLLVDPLQEDLPYWMGLVDYLKIKAFVELTVSEHSIRDGVQHLVRLSGLGAMKPNTIILGFYDETPPMNTFRDCGKMLRNIKFAKLERAEVVEYFTAQDFGAGGRRTPLSTSNSSSSAQIADNTAHTISQLAMDNRDLAQRQKSLSPVDYVAILADILRMNKNFCLARYFYKLDKESIFKSNGATTIPGSSIVGQSVSGNKKYVDVWPVDLVRPQMASTTWDNSSLFLLQLACILSMVDQWKSRTTLRVFLCVTSLQDMQRKEQQLREMLGQLRIQAKSILLPWDHVICHLTDADAHARDITALPESYLRAFNDLLQKNSGQSSVVFLNSPLPPLIENFSTNQRAPGLGPLPALAEKYERYLKCLETITDQMPPILLVHGISSVISTAL